MEREIIEYLSQNKGENCEDILKKIAYIRQDDLSIEDLNKLENLAMELKAKRENNRFDELFGRIDKIKGDYESEIRSIAIDYQHIASQSSFSYMEIANLENSIRELLDFSNMEEEFIENGIIGG